MKKSICTFVIGVTASVFAFAQEAAPEKKKDEGKFTMSGYIDSYYLTAFNNPQSGTLMGASTGRAFDRLNNQFALGLVQTKFTYTNTKSEMVIDLTFGPNAELGNFGNVRPTGYNGVDANGNPIAGFNPGTAASYFPSIGGKQALYGTSASIKQAYFTYKFTEKFSMTVGQFGTHIGYEVIDAPVNYHYSLSNLFNNGPFYHIGGKLNYAFSDKVGLMVGLVNNWDALTDWKKSKSVIGQLFVSPVDGWNIYLNAIIGANDDPYKVQGATAAADNAAAFPTYTRMLYDLTTGYQITDKFYMGLNAAFGHYSFDSDVMLGDAGNGNTLSKSASWYGVALYPNYKFNDMFGIGVRYEYFSDANGVRYIGGVSTTNSNGVASLGAVNQSITITAPITLADGHLQLKPEFRMDISNKNYYEKSDGTLGTGQQTLGMAFIYKY